ncbi:MAG TPA: phosphoribosylamine--glycine ligase [Chitinophagaceae bacterium]|nr:phosphoribosylamine--glycine ligase [Chitinophagaceae bacterium]
MIILILGGGGREHALAWKISQSKLCQKLFIAPGNPGTASLGQNIQLDVNDFDAIKKLCLEQKINMVVVGPEDPLVNGIYDYFANDETLNSIQLIGPSQQGAMLEGSKAFAKEFMLKYKIPTASYKEFQAYNFNEGIEYLNSHTLPIVLKADGLAAGKGVVIAQTHNEAINAFHEMLQDNKFGKAGSKVVIEEFLDGIECSVFALSDGINYLLLPTAKDYKRIGEGDQGLNTGGMGAISPVPFVDDTFINKVKELIIEPTIHGLKSENIIYKGFIFFGLIKVNNEPFVIEYNCRMGDPETEVVLPRLENDIVEMFQKMNETKLNEIECIHSNKAATTIMLVSQGYPEDYKKGFEITQLDKLDESLVFHAGTKIIDNKLVTNGGRVLAITSLGNSIKEALEISNSNANKVAFEGKYFRKDIGWEFL